MRVGSKKSENLERSRGVAQRKSELSIIKDERMVEMVPLFGVILRNNSYCVNVARRHLTKPA